MTPPRVPAVLRELRGWLVWRLEHHEGEPKPRKVPYYADGRRRAGKQGSPRDRARLATFEDAMGVLAGGGWDGVGLAMLADWGLVGLDFDECAVEGVVHPDVEVLVAETYCEFSPSGTGVRAFMRGALPDRKSRAAGGTWGVEFFHRTGFLTVTGNLLPICELMGHEDTVEALTSAVEALYVARFGPADALRAVDKRVAATTPLGLPIIELERMLGAVDADTGYETWLRVGMAIHHERGGAEDGLALWDVWSARGTKYPGLAALAEKWASFGASGGAEITARWLCGLTSLNLARDDFDVLPVGGGVGTPPPPLPSFVRDKKTEAVLVTMDNMSKALARPDITGMSLGYDTFRDAVMYSQDSGENWATFRDSDYSRIRIALERIGFKPPAREITRDAVALVAETHMFDSAQVWLSALMWDGVPRIERFHHAYLGAVDSPYTRSVSRYLWTALAGRVMDPGCKVDMVPVWVSKQGTRKSSTVAAISPDPDFFAEISFAEREDDLSRKMRGRLIAELAELKGLNSRDEDHIKAWITKRYEDWVPKFREFATKFPRRLVFVGTINRQEFLSDQTGNRRWLPVDVGDCADVEAIERDRLQLWAEARERWRGVGIEYRQAETLAQLVHDAYMIRDAWEDIIRAWLREADLMTGEAPGDRRYLRAVEVLTGALRMEAKTIEKRHEMRVGAALRALGYERTQVRVEGKQKTVWLRPPGG